MAAFVSLASVTRAFRLLPIFLIVSTCSCLLQELVVVQLPPPESTLRWCRIHVARYALRANLNSQPANFDFHIHLRLFGAAPSQTRPSSTYWRVAGDILRSLISGREASRLPVSPHPETPTQETRHQMIGHR